MNEIIKTENIRNRIITIRGLQVMIDRDLAEFYGVSTKRLNEQVRRNINRFPKTFRFQLDENEKNEVVANCDHLKNLKYSYVLPHVFTEPGVAMLSAILHSETAINISVAIMQAFVEMRKFIINNASIFQRLEKVEYKQIAADRKIDQIFNALQSKELTQKQGIFYNGQVFDAYSLIADITRSAKKSIILIDNYIDDTVLKLFTKRKKGVKTTIYCKTISKVLKQDLTKHNNQYEPIEIRNLKTAHDRFLIIDEKTIYHFGASLKDLGKKWFAFSKLKMESKEIIDKL